MREGVTLPWGISTKVGDFVGRFGGRSNTVSSACFACLACCVVPTAFNGKISIRMARNMLATASNTCCRDGGFLALGMAEGMLVGKDSSMKYEKVDRTDIRQGKRTVDIQTE